MTGSPSSVHISHRRLKLSSAAARFGFGSISPLTPHAPETGLRPRSLINRLAVASVSDLRNPSSKLFVISTSLIPALAQPSSDPRKPALDEVFWCSASVILPSAASAARIASKAAGASSISRLDSMMARIIDPPTRVQSLFQERHMPQKLVGADYTTPDLVAKVTGRARYAEDFRADGMLFCKLLLSPLPHARVLGIDTATALAMPGVKAVLTADDLPPPAQPGAERALTNEPLYHGEPILA